MRHNYSFATEYCAWHRPEHYPMFDDFVRRMLVAYRDKDNFATFEDDDLRHYPQFKRVFIAFQNHYGLTGYSFRELDHFLWGYGKVLFPRQYKRNTEQLATPYSKLAALSPQRQAGALSQEEGVRKG